VAHNLSHKLERNWVKKITNH